MLVLNLTMFASEIACTAARPKANAMAEAVLQLEEDRPNRALVPFPILRVDVPFEIDLHVRSAALTWVTRACTYRSIARARRRLIERMCHLHRDKKRVKLTKTSMARTHHCLLVQFLSLISEGGPSHVASRLKERGPIFGAVDVRRLQIFDERLQRQPLQLPLVDVANPPHGCLCALPHALLVNQATPYAHTHLVVCVVAIDVLILVEPSDYVVLLLRTSETLDALYPQTTQYADTIPVHTHEFGDIACSHSYFAWLRTRQCVKQNNKRKKRSRHSLKCKHVAR